MSNVIAAVSVETIKAEISRLENSLQTWHEMMTNKYQTMGFNSFEKAIESNEFLADITYTVWRDFTIEINTLRRLIK